MIRLALIAAVLLCGCGAARPVAESLPERVEGWNRERVEPVALETLPAEIRERSPESAARGWYAGPSAIAVTLCRMRTDASAFALMQSWRPLEGRQPFYRGRLFGFAEGENAMAFVRAFEKALP